MKHQVDRDLRSQRATDAIITGGWTTARRGPDVHHPPNICMGQSTTRYGSVNDRTPGENGRRVSR